MPKLSFDYAKLTSHVRFRALVKRLDRDEARALHCLCRFWNQALEAWGNGRALVPTEIFDLDEDFAHLIPTCFAERRDEGVYAKGSVEFFDWLPEQREAAARGGRASAEARRIKYGSADPRAANPEADVNDSRTVVHDLGTLAERPVNASRTDVKSSVSVSSSVSQTITPPKSPQAEDRPKISRSEQRAMDRVAVERATAASNHAAAAFACAATVTDPYGEYSSSAYGTLDPAVRRFLRALYPGGDGWAHLVRAIARHRQTRSPDARFAQHLRESFAVLAATRPDLLSAGPTEQEDRNLVPTHQIDPLPSEEASQ